MESVKISPKFQARTSLELADSIILAAARLHGAILWTQDEHSVACPARYFPRR
jgi:toxin FitB